MHKRCRYTPPCKKGWRKGVAKKMNPCCGQCPAGSTCKGHKCKLDRNPDAGE